MCRKRLSSPRCRSELIDSAWAVIVPGQKCINNNKKIIIRDYNSRLGDMNILSQKTLKWKYAPNVDDVVKNHGLKSFMDNSPDNIIKTLDENLTSILNICKIKNENRVSIDNVVNVISYLMTILLKHKTHTLMRVKPVLPTKNSST